MSYGRTWTRLIKWLLMVICVEILAALSLLKWYTEEIKKALRAVDLMKLLDGQVAIGGKSGTKALGEHKVT